MNDVKSKALSEYKLLIANVRALPQPRIYLNLSPVVNVCGVDLTSWDVLTGAIIGNLNTLLTGARGEGKTQLENELKSAYFGGRVTYIRMRDNMRLKELYEVYNLAKLVGGKGTVLQAKEQTGAIKNPMTIIDEINRAHEKVQNQVFDIYDGYIIFEGPNGPEKIQLGIKVEDDLYFHVAIASANIGATQYAGISPIDSALLDRSHLILNVDNFTPTTVDTAVILGRATTPKVVDYHNNDHTDKIVEIHRGVKDIKLSLDALVALLYLKKGIDHCIHPDNPTRSKTPLLQSLPNICEGCSELGRGCGYTYPVSTRTDIAITLLAKSLKVVADSKSQDVQSLRVRYQDILGAFMLVAPYSGMLDENWVSDEFMGNQQFAINRIAQGISTDINRLKDRMKNAYAEAIDGKLTNATRKGFTGRWTWYGDLLVGFDAAAKKLGNLSKLPKEEKAAAMKDHPILQWTE